MKTFHVTVLWYILATFSAICLSFPVVKDNSSIDNETIDALEEPNLNDSQKNLYVVKAVVYEIGILTEVDDNDTNNFESQERVDLTFFDAHTNQSHIDLGNIPLPIQTNVSGQVLTGISPVNIGAFSSASELLETLPLTGSIVNITHSDTAFYKLTTSNVSAEERPRIVNVEELRNIPEAAALFHTSVSTTSRSNNSAGNSAESI